MASSPITSWHTDGEKVQTVTGFIFLGSKITADGDCSHEIKRCFLLGRKAMTNLDSVLKRDITLLMKVHIVKAMVFSSSHVWFWALDCKKKSEHWKTDAFELCFWRFLRVPWTAKRSNLKEINPEYSLEGLMVKLKLQYFGHLMPRTNSLDKTLMLGKIEGRRRRTEDEMVGWHYWLDGHELE